MGRSGAGSVGRPPYRQTPVGFGSSTPRKTSTPVKNGRTPSNSSQDRTPMSGRMRSKSYITPRPSELIKSTSATNIPKFVGCYSSTATSHNSSAATTPLRSRTPSSSSIPVPTNSYRIRTPSSSSIPIPINQRTRTPTSGSGNIQRSGSGLSENRSNRTAKTTTSYGADGSRITTTTSSYSYDASKAGASQQTSNRQW